MEKKVYTFAIAYLKINQPNGGPARMHNNISLDSINITIAELKKIILEWAINNTGHVTRMEILTPLDENDDERSLQNWVEEPTQFQISNHIDSENKLFQQDRNAYGKWCVDFYYD